jgi:hypothetical protein
MLEDLFDYFLIFDERLFWFKPGPCYRYGMDRAESHLGKRGKPMFWKNSSRINLYFL